MDAIQEFVAKLVCKVLGINSEIYIKQLTIGCRPVKAAIKLGACPTKAELLCTLKLATTAEEINFAYDQPYALSCMAGEPVGDYYEINNIFCLYNDFYRVLYNPDTHVFCRSYGIKAHLIEPLLQEFYEFSRENFIRHREVVSSRLVKVKDATKTVVYPTKKVREYFRIFYKYKPINIQSVPSSVLNEFYKEKDKFILEDLENVCSQFFNKSFCKRIQGYSFRCYFLVVLPGDAYSLFYSYKQKRIIKKEYSILKESLIYEPYKDFIDTSDEKEYSLEDSYEEHYLKSLGSEIKLPIKKSRTNYSRKYTPKGLSYSEVKLRKAA